MQNHEARRLVSDLIFFFKKTLFDVNASCLQFSFSIFEQPSTLAYNKNKLYKLLTIDPEMAQMVLIFQSPRPAKRDSGTERRLGVFIVNFQHISHLVLVFLLLNLNMQMSAGKMDIPIACNDRHQEKQCYKIFFKCYNISYISNITFKLYNFLLVSKILYNFRFYNFLLVFFSNSFSTFYFAIFPFDSPDFQGDFVS